MFINLCYYLKVIIIHWTFGNSKENWFPWLKQELESNWHKVWVPDFPTPDNQSLQSWCNVLEKQVPFIFDEETILIGHSLWAAYILNILNQKRNKKVKKAILVSAFVRELNNNTFDELNKTFIEKEFNRDLIKSNIIDIEMFYWDNDPYVPFIETEYLQQQLNCNINIIHNWWHLNASAGFNQFDQILERII